MRNRRWIVNAVMFLTLSACNLPSNETPLSPPTLGTPSSTSFTPTPIPIETLLARQTPIRLPTITPSLSVVFTNDAPVNCRSGPGTSYTVIGELKVGRQAEMIGKSADLSWWYVKNPNDPSTSCWLFADVVLVEGNVDSLPVVNPPEIVVTTISVSIEPPVMNVACDGFPRLVTINVQITTNGPATVVWRWEEKSSGDVSSEKNILFEEGGTKTVQDLYQVKSAKDYTMVVRTLQPNLLMGQANFKAVCTP
jgi:hypothetical protein